MANHDRPRLIFHGAIVLIGMGYAFAVALVLGGIIGVVAFEPGRTPAALIAFLAAVVGIFGAIVTTALTIKGAGAALRS